MTVAEINSNVWIDLLDEKVDYTYFKFAPYFELNVFSSDIETFKNAFMCITTDEVEFEYPNTIYGLYDFEKICEIIS